jgi:hypothetical protein
MNRRGQKPGLQRGDRTQFPYEPRVIGGKLVMPAELQRIHRIILDAAEVEIISDEMRAVVESLWPEAASVQLEMGFKVRPTALGGR